MLMQSERSLWRGGLLLLLFWTISWTPYALVFLFSLLRCSHYLDHHLHMLPGHSLKALVAAFIVSVLISRVQTIAAVFCKLSVAVNPFVYGLM